MNGAWWRKETYFLGHGLLCNTAGWLIIQVLVPLATFAAEAEPFPLEPPDTSSPRATLESFMRSTAEGTEAYRRGEPAARILPLLQRAERALDLSEVSPDRARSVAIEAGLLLYEVLNRVGLPDYTEIPGEAEVEGGELRAWRVPRTEISIARVEEGDGAGEFLFSPQTVARASEFYERIKHLPQKTDYPPATYEEYVTRPDFRLPYLWADELPAWAKERVLRNPVWKWLAVLVALAVGVLAGLLVYRIGHGWDKRFGRQGSQWRLGTLVFATSLVVIPLAFEFLLERVIGLRFEVQAVISKSMFALAFAAGVFVLFALFEFIAEVLIGLQHLREMSVNAHLIRVTNRILGIVASIFLVIEATNYLGFALTPVLAGLGIGGLAVALAARPTLENIIGGFTLFADKPVRVGDFCRFGDETGTVEEIGLRSTRIRKLNDVVVSVPNADFSQMQLQNYTRMRTRLYRTTLALRYETTPEQLRYVLAKLRAMLLGHPKVSPDQLHVRFLSFGAYSLDLEIFAYTRTRDWLTFRAICEDINLRIMDIIKEAGTGFAFPSQTNYFVRDGGLDAERGREAETQVEHWRLKGKLPFPEFEPAEREQLEDNLDYPVEGSPEHRPRKSMSDTAPKSESESSPKPKRFAGFLRRGKP